jgi:predicted nucleotidyltransferase
MPDPIKELLPRLEAKRLKLVFSAESGSRAWGFASPDSDYDVRFIFCKDLQRYLSLQDGVQDIQYKADGDLDYAGWDLRKALLLAGNSNPSLVEWLLSPIIYADEYSFRAALRSIMAAHFNPRALAHHYVNFMRNIRGKYLSDFVGEYTMKRYFYALRPILAIMWMQGNPMRLPPIGIIDLLAQPLDHEIKREVGKLLKLKIEAREKEDYKSPALDGFIHDWFDKGHELVSSFPVRAMDMQLLDDLFVTTLESVTRNSAGWSSPVARQAHNLKVEGSNPSPASTQPAAQAVS